MNSNLLALLKRLAHKSPMHCCPECDHNLAAGIHESFCELKAQIDRLEAEQASERNEGHA